MNQNKIFFTNGKTILVAGNGITFEEHGTEIIISSTGSGNGVIPLYSGKLNLNTTADQIVSLASFGNNFKEINIILDNTTANISVAKELTVNTAAARAGTALFTTKLGGSDSLQELNAANKWISVQDGDIVIVPSPKIWVPSIIYLKLTTAQNAVCDILITGIKAN